MPLPAEVRLPLHSRGTVGPSHTTSTAKRRRQSLGRNYYSDQCCILLNSDEGAAQVAPLRCAALPETGVTAAMMLFLVARSIEFKSAWSDHPLA